MGPLFHLPECCTSRARAACVCNCNTPGISCYACSYKKGIQTDQGLQDSTYTLLEAEALCLRTDLIGQDDDHENEFKPSLAPRNGTCCYCYSCWPNQARWKKQYFGAQCGGRTEDRCCGDGEASITLFRRGFGCGTTPCYTDNVRQTAIPSNHIRPRNFNIEDTTQPQDELSNLSLPDTGDEGSHSDGVVTDDLEAPQDERSNSSRPNTNEYERSSDHEGDSDVTSESPSDGSEQSR